MRIDRFVYPVVGVLVIAGLFLLLTGCGGGGDGGGGGGIGSGHVGVMMTDAPPSAGIAEVHVHITKIEAVGSGGPVTLLDDAQIPDDIDLVALAHNPLLLGQPLIAAGNYTQIRLILSTVAGQNWIKMTPAAGGATHDLTVPSGGQTGAKIITGNLAVPKGGTVFLLLDFNAQASVHQAGNSGKWMMRPTIFASVVPSTTPGLASMQGTVLDGSGHALAPPVGDLLGVFIQTTFGPIFVAEVSNVDGSYLVSGLVVGDVYTVQLYFASPDGVPVGAALQYEQGGGGLVSSINFQMPAAGTFTENLVVPSA